MNSITARKRRALAQSAGNAMFGQNMTFAAKEAYKLLRTNLLFSLPEAVDGKAYHHIIDPDTLMPAAYWQSVSIVCGDDFSDSGLADALSTALFLMDAESGEALVKEYGADAYWIAADGTEYMTDGFEKMLRT